MKYRLTLAALMLSWPAYAEEVATPAASVEAPVAAPEVVAPPVDVAPAVVEAPSIDIAPPVTSDIQMDIPTPEIGGSMVMPDITPPIETGAVAAPAMPEMPAMDVAAPTLEEPVAAPATPEVTLPLPEIAPAVVEAPAIDVTPSVMMPEPSMDAGLKMAMPEHPGGNDGNNGNGGMPEVLQPQITVDTAAIGKGGDAYAEGGDANAVLKNDVDLSSVNINKDGDVSNTAIVKPEIDINNVVKPEIENTNVVKQVQEIKVDIDNKDITKIDVTVKPNIDVTVKPEVEVKTGDVKVYVQAPVQQQTETRSPSSSSSLGVVGIGIGAAALLLSKRDDRGDDRDRGYRTREREVVTKYKCFEFNRYGEKVRVSCNQKAATYHPEKPDVPTARRQKDHSKGVIKHPCHATAEEDCVPNDGY